MNFSFTAEQLLFKEQVLKFARKEIVPRCHENGNHLKGPIDGSVGKINTALQAKVMSGDKLVEIKGGTADES